MKAVLLHPLGYEDRPRGHEPDHFAHIEQTMVARGHEMLPAERIDEADVLLFNSDVWNIEGGTSPYDKRVLTSVLQRHIPVVWFDYFDHAGDDKSQGRWPGSDDWKDMLTYVPPDSHHFAWFGWWVSRGKNPLLFFMRKMQIHQDYPDYVHPIEHPILEDHPLVSKEELCARHFDVCGLTNIGLTRAVAMIDLYRDGRLKLDCQIIPSYRRLDHFEWTDRHREAKFFLEADASLGSERPLKLITVAPMLRVKSDHKLPFPRVDMEHMVEIGDYDGAISKGDVDKVLSVLNDPALLYKIYVQGSDHTRRHYSLEARSKYVLEKIEEFVK